MLLSTCRSNTPPVDPDKPNPISSFLRSVSGQEKDDDVISIDHNYSKLWSCHPDSHHAKPARLLFIKGLFHRNDVSPDSESVIDVESEAMHIMPPYDNAKTRALFHECDQFLANSLPAENQEEKEPLNKSGWTAAQRNLYKHVVKVIHSNRLSKLAHSGAADELVKRKIAIDKGAGKVRQLFAANAWDMKLLSWLHGMLMETLSAPLLSEYFEILRMLKAKVPNLTDKFLAQVGALNSNIFNSSSIEALNQLLHKHWDPIFTEVNQLKPHKLPGNPLILIVPSSPNYVSANQSQRMRFWNSQLSSFGKVVQLPVHLSHNIAVDECLNHIFTMARNKVIEMRSHSPKRPILLLGWTIGALIACHVALEEPVNAVVCLGFPLKGVSGSRGDLDDPLLDSKVPTLFVIGQNSSTCSMDDIEDFRERMRAETGLVVVGGADDMLRVSVTKKKSEGVTQAMVDKCLVDEVGDFLAPILNQQYSNLSANHSSTSKKMSFITQQPQHFVSEEAKRQRRRPREYSPEISPIKRKTKPVGRPSMQKVLSSTSSSDTSSVGSCANEGTLRKDKRSPTRKGSRHHSTNMLRKRQKSRSATQNHEVSDMSPRIDKEARLSSAKDGTPSSSGILLSTSTTNAAKTLPEQEKNVPVDIEKAFGSDSCFLPRPLTPAEFEGNESTAALSNPNDKSTLLGLVDESNVECSASSIQHELPVSNRPTLIGVTLSSILSPPEKQKVSYLKTSVGNYPLTSFSTHVNSTVAIQKPQVVSKISEPVFDANKTCITSVQKLQSNDLTTGSVNLAMPSKNIIAVSQSKVLSGGGLNVKHVQGILSLTGKGLTSTASTSIKSHSVLMNSPSSVNKPTFLMSNSESSVSPSAKFQFRRMLVQGSPSKLPLLSKLTSPVSVIDDNKASHSTEQRVCNLSLLSDVAGMKEPIRQTVHDVQTSANATLVKLTSVTDASSSLKRIRVIEAVPPLSTTFQSSHLETPEELTEREIAIQSISNCLKGDDDNDDDSSMNYAFASSSKLDSNVGSHPLSSMLGYSVVMPNSGSGLGLKSPPRRGRGRAVSGFPSARKVGIQRYFQF